MCSQYNPILIIKSLQQLVYQEDREVCQTKVEKGKKVYREIQATIK